MKKIAILGSTGSIGTQTLEVISHIKGLFKVDLLSGHSNYNLLIEQAKKFNNIQIVEYTVGPKIINIKGKSHHEWLIEFKNTPKNIDLFEKEIDNNLRSLNPYYNDLIKDGVLTTLKIKIMKKKSFINFMKSIGKLGGQIKSLEYQMIENS